MYELDCYNKYQSLGLTTLQFTRNVKKLKINNTFFHAENYLKVKLEMKIALIISMSPICLYTIYVFIYVYVRYAQVFQGNTLTHPSHTHTLTHSPLTLTPQTKQ